MEKLQALKDKFLQLPEAMPGIMKGVFNQIKSVVEDKNIEQLDRGERPDGSSLPNYSIASVQRFGKRPGPMNMHNLGHFWAGITLEVYDNGVELVGHDIKTEMLELRWGKLTGLQEGSQRDIEGDYLKPEIDLELRNNYFVK